MNLAVAAPVRGRLLRRYKRFLADVELESGERLTVHCPDPGGMRGLALAGTRVRCSRSDDPRRKLTHTLEMVRAGGTWVGVNTGRANAVVARAFAAGAPRGLAGYALIEREVAAGPGCRIDFRLSGARRDARPAWVEVKSVTLAESRTGLFPDSVSLRARRHMQVLARLARDGARSAVVFLVQRADCDSVSPADAIDPGYARALREAVRAGVEVFALGARVGPRGIRVERELPVRL